MTEQETREKIAEIIYHTGCTGACCECDYSKISETDTYCKTLLKAYALIAAGIGDVSEYKEKLKLHRVFVCKDGGDIKVLYGNNEVDEIVKERNEYKHRAEVAEKELAEFKEKVKFGTLVEPIWFISHMNGLPCYGRVIGYEGDGSGFVVECKDCLISAQKIYLTEAEAEKELAEERNADNR